MINIVTKFHELWFKTVASRWMDIEFFIDAQPQKGILREASKRLYKNTILH